MVFSILKKDKPYQPFAYLLLLLPIVIFNAQLMKLLFTRNDKYFV